jgi:hypothetical protein
MPAPSTATMLQAPPRDHAADYGLVIHRGPLLLLRNQGCRKKTLTKSTDI